MSPPHSSLWMASLLGSALCAGAQMPEALPDTPAEPLPAFSYHGWPQAYRLANTALEVHVVPAVGRIVSLAPAGGGNLLQANEADRGYVPPPGGVPEWRNVGGDWLWPVAQSQWKVLQSSDWPPPAVLGDRPWQASAWIGADGAPRCRLWQEYGDPLRMRVSRRISLDPAAARVTVEQQVEGLGAPAAVPATLWQIAQVHRPTRVFIPVEPNSAFPNGYVSLFAPPAAEVVAPCGDVLALDAERPGEFKLGSDSRRAWIAARIGSRILVARAVPTEAEGSYPDGGCTLQVYCNSGLGYAEIETLSVERPLAAGESIRNTVTLDCLQVPERTSDCEAIALIKRHLGEAPEIVGADKEPAAATP